MRLRKLLALLLIIITIIPCSTAVAATDGMIRVKCTRFGSVSELNFTTGCEYAVNGNTGVKITKNSKVNLKLNGDKLVLTVGSVSKEMGTSFSLIRMGTGNSGVKFNGYEGVYAGDLYFSKSGSNIVTILHIYVENYLLGVVGYEMSDSSPIEALKAQAICARTLALNWKSNKTNYDVVDNSNNQVYRGYRADYKNVIQAVNDTRGQVLWYNNKYAGAYYSASNGGQTESSKNAWGSNAAYLQVKDDPYDYESNATKKTAYVPKYPSEKNVLNAYITLKLKEGVKTLLSGKGLSSDPKDIEITEIYSIVPKDPMFKEPSKRYKKLTFNIYVTSLDKAGNKSEAIKASVDIATYDYLQDKLDLSINSANNETIYVEASGEGFNIVFRRWGHGIGMSQAGAKVMAKTYSKNYKQIFEFYFPGCEVKTLDLTDTSGSKLTKTNETQVLDWQIEYETLKYGMSGAGVKQLQSRLKQLGYFSGEVLGNYKTQTKEAVELFQKTAGLKVDGIAGHEVQKLLFSDEAPEYKASTTPTPTVKPTATPAPSASENALGKVEAKSSSVKVYEKAKKSAKVLGKLKKGTVVDLLAKSGDWYKISLNGKVGYVLKKYFKTYEPKPEPNIDITKVLYKAAVKSSSMKVYTKASTSSKKLGTLKKGKTVNVLLEKGTWCCIELNGKVGYAKTSSLKKVTENNTNTQTETLTATLTAKAKLYKSKSTTAKYYGKISKNETVTVISYDSKWCKVEYKGYTGFVLKKYLKLK